MLIDSHCHLYFDSLNADLQDVLERAQALGVGQFICVGIDLESSRKAVAIADQYTDVFATVGVHPHEASNVPKDFIRQLEVLLEHPKVIAIGETGLDYYRNLSEPVIQRSVFRSQLDLAYSNDVPVVIHNRNADREVIAVLKEAGIYKGVAHCFSSDLETAKAFLEIGLRISFAGNLTYKNNNLPMIAKKIPLKRILVETDSPFLSPVPFRGKPNEPWRIRYIVEKLAEIHGIDLDAMTKITRSNTENLFFFQ
jgi:TatD DNase family protein